MRESPILNRTTRRGIGSHGHKTEEFYAGGVFASGSDVDQLVSSRATSTRGSIPSLRFTLRSRMSWRIFLHAPSGDVYLSRDWTLLKLWEEHRFYYEDLPGGWYLRAVSQPLRRAAAQGTGWARGRRNAGPVTQPADAVDHAGHHPRGLRVRSRDRVLP